MMAAAATLLAQFEAAAKTAGAAEAELRKSLGAQIARAEQQRVHAFRRARFARVLAGSVPAEASAEDTWVAQKQAVSDDLGWSTISESYEAILERMRPLAGAIQAALLTPDERHCAIVATEVESFEEWFSETHGKAFYVLFDQYVPEVPVVDF